MEIFRDKKIQEIICSDSLAYNIKNIPFLTQGEIKKLMGVPWGKHSKTLEKILLEHFKDFQSTPGFDSVPKKGLKGVYICLGDEARDLDVAGSVYFNEEDWAANADFYPNTTYDKSGFLCGIAEELEDCGLVQNNIDNLLCILIAFTAINTLKKAKKIKAIANAGIVMGYSDGDEVILGHLKDGIFKEDLKVISEYVTPSSEIKIPAPKTEPRGDLWEYIFWNYKSYLTERGLFDEFILEGENFAKKICVEHEGNIFINRCMKCHHIKKTPRAKLCLGCGDFDENFIPH